MGDLGGPWNKRSYIYTCALTGNRVRLGFSATCSVYAVIKCKADHYHPELFEEPCKSCDLYKTRIDVPPGDEPPEDPKEED